MFSTAIKRSVATLGVVAGLLAAAGPASAMPVGTIQDLLDPVVKAPERAEPAKGTQVGSEGVKVPIDDMDLSNHAVRSPESTVILNGTGDDQMKYYLEGAWPSLSIGGPEAASFVNGCAPGSAPVRQVGSEGVKAPVPASLVDYYGGVCYFHTP